MPELPEVETTRRGLEPLIVGHSIQTLEVRERRLRWPVENSLGRHLAGQRISSLGRRGKYLLINLETGTLLVHLGMSGSLRYLAGPARPGRHDHIDLMLSDGGYLRYNDPRRFGSMHFTIEPDKHPLLASLGPEPLAHEFTGDYLWRNSRGRKLPVKQLIMNGSVVVGVGNIYANEALYRAGIHPARAAGRISRMRIQALVDAIRAVLEAAIICGGTTLRDFVGGDGRPGYFRQSLDVYERAGKACRRCGAVIRRRVIGQRASYFCPQCQR